MASITMTAASFPGAAALSSTASWATSPRRLIVANRVGTVGSDNAKLRSYESSKKEEQASNGRRDLMLAGMAAAICSVAGIATAEPKRGTPEAKKIYAPVCVTMPTARICHS